MAPSGPTTGAAPTSASSQGRPHPPLRYVREAAQSFGAGLFNFPHGIRVDRDGNVWVTDHGNPPTKLGHQVFKFSPDGKVLLTLGHAGMSGNARHVQQPVGRSRRPQRRHLRRRRPRSDANARIVKFDKTGKFIKTWGRHGRVDTSSRVARAGHGFARTALRRRPHNNRVQVFDQDGKLLASWKQFGRPSGIFIDRDDMMYVTDSESRKTTSPATTATTRASARPSASAASRTARSRPTFPTRSRRAGRAAPRGSRSIVRERLRRGSRPARHEKM